MHFFEGSCGLFLISALFRASAYRECGGFDERMEQLPDFDLFVRLAGIGEFYISADHDVDFRIHPDGSNLSAPVEWKIPRLTREWVHLMRHFREPGVDWLELAERSWEIGTRHHRWFAIDTALAIDPAALSAEKRGRLAQFTRRALSGASRVWPAVGDELREASRVVEATRAEVRKLRDALEEQKAKTAALREKLERRKQS